MFNLCEPQEHHLYKSSIIPFLEELQSLKVLRKDQDLTQAIFLLVKEEIEGINGGILLLKQSLSLLPAEIRDYLPPFCLQLKEVWTGMVALQMCKGITGQDFEKICKILYRSLL